MLKTIICLLTAISCTYAYGQHRSLDAVKINQSIKIDGNLDDAGWKGVPSTNDFTVTYPDVGKKSARRTEVKIAYDNSAVYIGAYLYDNPGEIRRQITSRDVLDLQDADFFSVELDTYNDKQNGFLFQVSAAGVQGDAKISQNFDRTWDAVWESSVSIKPDGWVAEFKIPFSAIRFAKVNIQNWGLQFIRFKRKTNENSAWNPEDPAVNGMINKWGTWAGIRNISPPLRLSFSPYLSGGVRISPTSKGDITEYLKSGGMDVKYGINESFTLDMTLIPDFAQVQSDNVVLNLSPFEVKFNDYRPFFTEGTELFNKAGLFYPRRIGDMPGGADDVLQLTVDSPQYRIIKNPGITRLYNATKLSGRTKKNLGIGILNALTATMYAKVENQNTKEIKSIQTEPLANYNIIVLDQAFAHRSSVTFTNTNVLRKGNLRNANVTALDVALIDKKNIYGLFWDGNYSTVWGKNGNYDGYKTDIQFSKLSGNLQGSLYTNILSDTYDPTDLGFLRNNNAITTGGSIGYNIYKPTKKFINQRFSIRLENYYLYKPFIWQNFLVQASSYLLFKNFWDVSTVLQIQPLWGNDFFEPRTPGRFLKRIPIYFLTTYGSSDSRKKLFYNFNFAYGESPLPNDPYYSIETGLRYRFNNKFQLSGDLTLSKDRGNWGFAYRDNMTGEPIIGQRNIKTDVSVFNAIYNFNAKSNLSIRLRHYWSMVHYTEFFDLKTDGYWTPRTFVNGYDQNFNTFNVDMFYTWDFLPGSRITFAWKNALGNEVSIDGTRYDTYLKNFGRSFDNPHSNEFTLKVVYFLDYLLLKRK